MSTNQNEIRSFLVKFSISKVDGINEINKALKHKKHE